MKSIISFLFLGLLILIVFKNIFVTQGIVGGDWPYFFSEQLHLLSFPPTVWNAFFDLGNVNRSPWIDSYLYFVVSFFVNTLGIPWNIVQLCTFFFLAIILAVASSTVLYKSVTGRASVVPAVIYLCNTYFLMIFGGGQMGIVLAYAIAPLVVLAFLRLITASFSPRKEINNVLRLSLIASLLLATQLLFDLRIVYVTLVGIGLYWLFVIFIITFRNQDILRQVRNVMMSLFFVFVVPLCAAVMLQAYWLLPSLIYGINPKEVIGFSQSTIEGVKFFSFSQFEQSLSLLHPNWPENLFGKVYFMRAEFILIPLLAFSSLLFINSGSLNHAKQSAKLGRVLFFALLGLIGAFLAKGANEPFGSVYLFLFEHVPGFFMFRDPTKWYVLIAVSYAVLIPFSLFLFSDWINSKFPTSVASGDLRGASKIQKFLPNIFLLVCFVYFLVLLKPAISGELSGAFQKQPVPLEYIELKDFVHNQPEYFRTLWIPQRQRFGFYSHNHPSMNAQTLFSVASASSALSKLQEPNSEILLQQASIKYVIVPYDSMGEIFLEDRKYDPRQYIDLLQGLEQIPWLRKIDGDFGKIGVFVIDNPADHFWTITDSDISWEMISPSHYQVKAKNGTIDRLVFSEGFDMRWTARFNGKTVRSEKFNDRFNSFGINEESGLVDVYFEPQKWVFRGSILSQAAIVGMVLYFIYGSSLWRKMIKK